MKKLGILILALALLCTCLAGCGDGNVDRGDDGYIGDNGNVSDNGNNGNDILDHDDDDGNDILDPDDDDDMDGDDGNVPTAIPNNSPAISTQPITP